MRYIVGKVYFEKGSINWNEGFSNSIMTTILSIETLFSIVLYKSYLLKKRQKHNSKLISTLSSLLPNRGRTGV